MVLWKMKVQVMALERWKLKLKVQAIQKAKAIGLMMQTVITRSMATG
jgi:hypothetical protein